MAHAIMAPLRLLHYSMPSLLQEKVIDTLGLWYPKVLKKMGNMLIIMDEELSGLYHHSTVKLWLERWTNNFKMNKIN